MHMMTHGSTLMNPAPQKLITRLQASTLWTFLTKVLGRLQYRRILRVVLTLDGKTLVHVLAVLEKLEKLGPEFFALTRIFEGRRVADHDQGVACS